MTMKRRSSFFGAMCSTFFLGATFGQNINYQVGTGTAVQVAAGSDFTINVGTVSGTVLVRIWDPALVNGLPNDDAGKLTIVGTLDQGGGELQVFVAGESASWPNDPTTQLFDPGVRHLGLNASDGIEVLDDSLRRRTRLAGFMSQNINGTITVGQVQRLQCGNLDPNQVTGTIAANITTVASDAEFRTNTPPNRPDARSIGYISAGNGIHGTISATNAASFDPGDISTYASIEKIIVGPSTDPAVEGIRGSILAEQGKIDTIHSSGPIGTPTLAATIRAANGVREVRAVDEDGGELLERPFNVSLHAGVDFTPTGDLASDGCLQLLETAGSISGSIEAANIGEVFTSGVAPSGRVGIFAGLSNSSCHDGDILAPITVDFVVEGKIMGRRILAPVWIGRMLEGPIVAWDVDNPACIIPSITVGYGDDAGGAYSSWPQAFTGTSSPTRNVRQCAGDNGLIALRNDGLDEQVGSSTIVANRVVDLRLRQITTWEGPEESYAHSRIPRVEVQVIDSLTIGSFREGVVWSGVRDSVNPGDPSPWYSSIGVADINCMGSHADLWCQDVSMVSIAHSLFGEVWMPSLPANGMVRVGALVGLFDTSTTRNVLCECDAVGANCTCAGNSSSACQGGPGGFYAGPFEEALPLAEPRAAFGAIRIADPAGLHGQIILNANGSTSSAADLVQGVVALGTFESPTVVFSTIDPVTNPTDPRRATTGHLLPDYSALPGDDYSTSTVEPGFGGGAVGVIPFGVHQASSDNINTYLGVNLSDPLQHGLGLLTSELNSPYSCGVQPAIEDLYGPGSLQPYTPPYRPATAVVTRTVGTQTWDARCPQSCHQAWLCTLGEVLQ